MKVENRKQFHKLFEELHLHGHAVEVGVRAGVYSEYLLKECKFAKVFSVDLWDKSVNSEDSPTQIAADYERAKQVLGRYENSFILKMTAAEAVEKFPDNSLDFIYDDATLSHIDFVTAWWKKLRFGGIFAGRDFVYRGDIHQIGSQDYTNEDMWSKAGERIKSTLTKANISARILTTEEPFPSWFCKKERTITVL